MRVERAIAAVVDHQTERLQVNEVEPLDVRMILTDVRQFNAFVENTSSLFGGVLSRSLASVELLLVPYQFDETECAVAE